MRLYIYRDWNRFFRTRKARTYANVHVQFYVPILLDELQNGVILPHVPLLPYAVSLMR